MWLKIKLALFPKKQVLALGVLEQKINFWKPFLMLFPSLAAIILFTLIPFLITIINSLTETQKSFTDTKININNYWQLFQLTDFQIGLRNSLIYTILAVPISLIIALLVASTIVSLTRKWVRDTWLTIFFLPYVTSTVAISTAFFYIFNTDRGLINEISGVKTPWLTGNKSSWYSLVAIVINGVWGNLALKILILTTAMLAVNPDLYKASSIDGARAGRKFFAITLPTINRTLNFLITVGIISSIKVFPLALFNNNTDAAVNAGGSTLMLLIFLFIKDGGQTYYLSATISIVLFLIGIIVSLLLNGLVKLVTKSSLMIGDYRVQNKINRAKLLN